MVRDCGCAQGTCSCVFEDSDTVQFTGSGSVSDPIVATPIPLLEVADTSTLALTLDIADSEMILTAQPISVGHVDVFTADGTWNKPVGVTFARVMMIGAGGGGASGQSVDFADGIGGAGGDAGQVVNLMLIGAEIPASAAVVIGQGGPGGLPEINGDGNPGTAGTATSFDVYSVPGGAGGRALGVEPAHGPTGNPPGQFAVSVGDPDIGPHYYLAPGAGGMGEGFNWFATPGGYSHPGQGSRYPDDTGGGAIGGESGRAESVTKMGGGGGGGLTSNPGGWPTDGGPGGDGGLYGGGGGGGAYSSPHTIASGAGGNGANGLVVIVSW